VWVKTLKSIGNNKIEYQYIKIANLNSFSFNVIDCGNSQFDNNNLSRSPVVGENEANMILEHLQEV
jgi:hypothetical protein